MPCVVGKILPAQTSRFSTSMTTLVVENGSIHENAFSSPLFEPLFEIPQKVDHSRMHWAMRTLSKAICPAYFESREKHDVTCSCCSNWPFPKHFPLPVTHSRQYTLFHNCGYIFHITMHPFSFLRSFSFSNVPSPQVVAVLNTSRTPVPVKALHSR